MFYSYVKDMGNGIIEKEKLCLFTQEEIQQILSKRGLSLKNDIKILLIISLDRSSDPI